MARQISEVMPVRVVMTAGDGSDGTVSAPVVTSVNSLATSQDLLAANPARRGVIIYNSDANALSIKYGTPATTAGGGFTYQIAAATQWVMPQPIYTGIIAGIWAADGAGAAAITEL